MYIIQCVQVYMSDVSENSVREKQIGLNMTIAIMLTDVLVLTSTNTHNIRQRRFDLLEIMRTVY